MMNKNPPQNLQIYSEIFTNEELSAVALKVALLGDQMQEIISELGQAGYDDVAAAERAWIETFASTKEDLDQLYSYWREFAKETLAGRVNPKTNRYPNFPTYRSEFITSLRNKALSELQLEQSPPYSIEIEPTLRRFYQSSIDAPNFENYIKNHLQNTNKIRQELVHRHRLPEIQEFTTYDRDTKYGLLIERYKEKLTPAGFVLDKRSRKKGFSFRKLTTDKRWAILFVDHSWDRIENGVIVPIFAITLPKQAVVPEYVVDVGSAFFAPKILVPGFLYTCGFDRTSYAQFCLAADSISFLVQSVYKRLNALLVEETT